MDMAESLTNLGFFVNTKAKIPNLTKKITSSWEKSQRFETLFSTILSFNYFSVARGELFFPKGIRCKQNSVE